jgi:hypothetical protein
MTIIFILKLQFYFGLGQLIDPSVLSLGADFYVAVHLQITPFTIAGFQ